MNNPNPPSPLTTISAPATPELLYPWPKAALDIGLPWVWPYEIAKDLNKLEPFIAARVAEALTAAQHEHAGNETAQEAEIALLREALGVLIACASSDDAFGLEDALDVAACALSNPANETAGLIAARREGKLEGLAAALAFPSDPDPLWDVEAYGCTVAWREYITALITKTTQQAEGS